LEFLHEHKKTKKVKMAHFIVEKPKFGFRLTRLTQYSNGTITSPFSAAAAAKIIGKQMSDSPFAIYRIVFLDKDQTNPAMFQQRSKEGYSCFEHLIIMFPSWVAFAVDFGLYTKIVAICHENDELAVKIAKEDLREYEEVPKEYEIREFMVAAFEEMHSYKKAFLKMMEDYKQMQEFAKYINSKTAISGHKAYTEEDFKKVFPYIKPTYQK
jgi:hypothetical protein